MFFLRDPKEIHKYGKNFGTSRSKYELIEVKWLTRGHNQAGHDEYRTHNVGIMSRTH
jgi:hypothetical protein